MKKVWLGFLIGLCLFVTFELGGLARDLADQNTGSRGMFAPGQVQPQLRVHRRCDVNFSITNWGFLGSQSWNLHESPGCLFCDHPNESVQAPSFEFPSNSGLEYLFEGALWVGGVVEGETLVTVGASGWWWIYEWAPASDIIEREWMGDQECLAVFTDTIVPPPLTETPESTDWDRREHRPLHVEVTQRSYSWQSPPFDDFVILDYTVRNTGDRSISQAYLGFFLDTDVLGLRESYY